MCAVISVIVCALAVYGAVRLFRDRFTIRGKVSGRPSSRTLVVGHEALPVVLHHAEVNGFDVSWNRLPGRDDRYQVQLAKVQG